MNKIIVSIVITVILVFGINKIADVIYSVEKPEKSAYQVASVTDVNSSSTEENSESSTSGDVMALFASVNLSDGEKTFKKCAACHSVNKGGANKIGPALYNVIGRKAGSLTDYKYSKGMVAYAKEWTPQEMDGFLENPKGWVKGTKMAYAGIKDSKERAALILFLNQNGDDPLPLK
tara:strand:+ start:894 stop:1421 length:528 start_codon:yes stop_codon:yes gene_type:complete